MQVLNPPRRCARFARTLLRLEYLEDRTLLSNSSTPAILLLDPSAKGALSVTGQGGVLATGGGIVVINSSNAQAAVATGGSNVSAAEFDITGKPGFVTTGSATFQGAINSGTSPEADPLASLPVPPAPTNSYAAVNYSGTVPLVLSPGTYVGGIHISGQGSVTLLPGLYYLQGGGLSISGQGNVSGDDVMIYNDEGGAISVSGNGSLRLTPPTDGTYQDIALYQNPSSSIPLNLAGNGDINVTGTVYAPSAKMNITGNGGLTAPGTASTITEYVLYDLNITGNGNITADASYNQPLTLTVSLSPGPKFMPDGTPVTNVPQSVIQGTTKPGAQVDLETGSDGLFEDGHTTADASGVFSLPVTLAEGSNVLQVRATSRFDQQGITSTRVLLDTVPPETAATLSGPTDTGAWYRSAVTVALAATDNLSGVQSTFYALDGGAAQVYGGPITVSGDGVHTLSYWSIDWAGNEETHHTQTIQIDTVPPTVTIASPGPGLLTDQNVAITGIVTDSMSGVASLQAQVDSGNFFNVSFDSSGDFNFATALALDGSADGTHSVRVQAIDGAGNISGLSSVSFTLDASSRLRTIEHLTMNPSDVAVNTPTLITATVQLGADSALLPNQVYLDQLDSSGAPAATIGRMYDDGTHGDALPGDGKFTIQFTINQANPGALYFAATAEYRNTPVIAYSNEVTVNAVSLPSVSDVNLFLQDDQSIQSTFTAMVQADGLNAARTEILAALQNNPDIHSAILGDDGTTVTITYNNGLTSLLSTSPEGTLGSPSNNSGISLAFPGFTNGDVVPGILNDNSFVQCATLYDSNFTLNAVAGISNYGVIHMFTHGYIVNNQEIYISTGEKVPGTFLGFLTSGHLIDWELGRILPVMAPNSTDQYWTFAPSFISAHVSGLPNSLVVIDACHSLQNTSMANAFLAAGAKTYVGYTEEVGETFAQNLDSDLFTRLANGDSVQDAFGKWTISQRTDPTYGAVYTYTGDGSLTLPVDLIKNGSFETGDLTGWSTGFTPDPDLYFNQSPPGGYATAISERAESGSYSARLGRYDTVYTGGLLGQSEAGLEPSGDDWMYQDVSLPASGNFTLSFYWKVRTYDTAAYDWLEVTIEDPNTGATLATLVDHGGKPGFDYGVDWENDWQYVTYDLSQFAGHTIRVLFADHQDGFGDQTASYIDNVSIQRSNNGAQPQFFSGTPKTLASGTANLTQEQLQPVINQSITDLAAAGYNVSCLDQVAFHLVNLPDSLLGLTYHNTIWIDQNAQGYGWYADVSPNSNAAFRRVTGTNEVQAAPSSLAYGRVDLLTVVTHELGHILGFSSIDAGILSHDWMTATLGTGIRRYPDMAGGKGLGPTTSVAGIATHFVASTKSAISGPTDVQSASVQSMNEPELSVPETPLSRFGTMWPATAMFAESVAGPVSTDLSTAMVAVQRREDEVDAFVAVHSLDFAARSASDPHAIDDVFDNPLSKFDMLLLTMTAVPAQRSQDELAPLRFW